MNTVIPPALAPYLKECLDIPSLTLLTSVLNTPANWLVVRFLHHALQTQYDAKTIQSSNLQSATPSSAYKVILISIWRSLDLWSELTKKCGVNIHEKIASKQLCYIDGLLTDTNTKDAVIKLKGLTLEDMSNAISTALLRTTPASDSSSSHTVVVIDGIDLLLAYDNDATSTAVQHILTELQSTVHSVIVTCAADDPLLHNTDASATPLEHEHGELVRLLAYQAGLVFQLRPLETGHSKEVDGTVRVSRGGSWEGGEKVLEEGEWLYHMRGDGGVRVWSRGEA